MKRILILAAFVMLASQGSVAQTTGTTPAEGAITIVINSYTRLNQNPDGSSMAELCGNVKNAVGIIELELIIDSNSGNPGYYHTNSGTNGAFCQIVRTYGYAAQVNSISNGLNASSARAYASIRPRK